MKNISVIIPVLFLVSCMNQEEANKILKPASSFFPEKKTQVLVAGTFHFNYPGLDVNKTADKDKIDVLAEPKKSEVTELVEYIKKFKPTKIAIEATDSWNACQKLREYKAGQHQDNRDERYQLGMRIASELEIDTLYSIDSGSLDDDLIKIDSAYITNLFKDFDFKSSDPFYKMMFDWIGYEDKAVSKVNLLKYFKHINSKNSHEYNYGLYLIGDFKIDKNRGADILSIWWYNRNLRIFRKIQEITESPEDRILVLFGNGHAAILRQLLECSPEYDFIEFDSL